MGDAAAASPLPKILDTIEPKTHQYAPYFQRTNFTEGLYPLKSTRMLGNMLARYGQPRGVMLLLPAGH